MNHKRHITSADLHRMNWVNDPIVSPQDGKIAYIHKKISEQHDSYTSHIRTIHADGSDDMAFTSGEQDTTPAWSPDGSQLAFLRKKGDAHQVWIIPANGGEAHAVSDLKHGVSSFKWSPDGKSLLLKSEISEQDDVKQKNEKSEQTDGKTKLPEEMIIDRIKYKADGAGLWNGRRSHLFLMDLSTKEPVQLTSGHGNVGSFAWSPDGQQAAYVAEVSSDTFPNPDLRLTNDLFVIDLSSREVEQLTDEQLSIGAITYTPDGQHILLLADDLSCGFATLTRIYLIPASGGHYHALYTELDIQIGHACVSDMRAGAGTPPLFSQDGQSVYLQVSQNGGLHIARFALDGSQHEMVVTGDREIYQFALTADDKLVLAAADLLQPGDLFIYDMKSREETRLTDINGALWDELLLSEPEVFTFTTKDGWPIQGWIMKPTDYKDGMKTPAILEIHGGPQAMYGHTFMLEFQLLAAAGYTVFYTNPRGGHGYGQVHVNTVRGDYGGRDYQDLMEAVDYVLQAYPYIDADRLGVTGGSYGGFMTNWIVGHTDRFQAAVTQRSISNWISFYGVSDIGYYFTEDQIWGNPWDDLEKLWKHSPIAYVKNVNTPLLILHGEQDLRCPIEQGEQLFVALKRLGKEAQFIRFPGADHNLSRSGHPHLREKRLSHIVRWFEKHIER